MPRTKRKAVARKNVRIPKPIVDEVDMIVQGSGVYVDRQQFIESAVREKIEKSKPSEKMSDEFAMCVKDKFLIHAIANVVKEGKMPTDHLDLEKLGEYVRRYIEEMAERESKRLTKEQLDELTKYLVEILKELSP